MTFSLHPSKKSDRGREFSPAAAASRAFPLFFFFSAAFKISQPLSFSLPSHTHKKKQVLSLLGPIAGARVVELGAGIGRFTGALAGEECRAASVLAVDFMPNLIAENERVNGHLRNATFAVGDATELQLPAGSVDVLFSNWLLMYLGDEEVSGLATRALSWVVPGGVVFFRESCFRQSGDKKRAKNPTHYRDPREYFRLFDDARGVAADGVTKVRFELVTCRCVDTYVRLKQNQNQLCWKWRVVKVAEAGEENNGEDSSAAAAAAAEANNENSAAAAVPMLSSNGSSKSSTPAAAPAWPEGSPCPWRRRPPLPAGRLRRARSPPPVQTARRRRATSSTRSSTLRTRSRGTSACSGAGS